MNYYRKLAGALCLLALLLFAACETYQAAATFEPRPDAYAQGVSFTGDWLEYSEWSLTYFPESYPQPNGGFQLATGNVNYGFGLDALFKYPFHFGANHFSVFPILGADMRYFTPLPVADGIEPLITDYIGAGIKLGGGFDVTLTKEFFIRGKVLYSPGAFSFLQNEPGVRFSVGLGYRTEDDKVRKGFKPFKEYRRETALKKAKESFDKKNYDEAIVNYRKAIDIGASLGNSGITNLSTALYERAKQNQSAGNYRQALEDFNESMRHQYFMSRQKYADWKGLLHLYEEAYGTDAPHGGYGKLIFPANDNLTINYNRPLNGQTDPNEVLGSGWNINLKSGGRVFELAYDESNFNNGLLKSNNTKVELDVKEGHIYQAGAEISGSSVTITITDVTNGELGKNYETSPGPVFTVTLPLREEKRKPESITITIVNNTGYTIKSGGLFPTGGNTDKSDLHLLNLGGNIRSGNSRKVTLPALDTTKSYVIILMDTDEDTYSKWFVSLIPNMTLTFTISDLDT